MRQTNHPRWRLSTAAARLLGPRGAGLLGPRGARPLGPRGARLLGPRGARLLGPLLAVAVLASPASAHAAKYDPNGFRFTSTRLFVDENAGAAVITVERTNVRQAAQIRYITIGITAEAPYDYTPVKAMLSFDPGQRTATFQVPIIDHGIEGLPKTVSLSLFGPWPIGMADPSHAVLTILNNDPVTDLNPADPLGLPNATVQTNPLAGARFYVDPDSEAARAARRYPLLRVIASQPGPSRYGNFSYPNATISVARYLARAAVQQPGTIPMLTTYRIVYGHCGHWSDPPAEQLAYHNFIKGFARGIGSYKAVLFLEQDALITVGCLSRQGLAVRMHELSDAIDILTANCPHLVIYLDAGAADAVPPRETAKLLIRAGVTKIQGFFTDVTHYDWPLKEVRYGEIISRLTGGKHFVVSTGDSGRGPLIPPDRVHQGNEVLCNPPGRGLGPKLTTHTRFPNLDAFAWLNNPGQSGGQCVPGAPPTGVYWPQYALMLVRNANYAVR
jgi:endoglucanase